MMESNVNLAGKINVGVNYLNGAIGKVSVNSTRPRQLTRLLEGKTPEDVVQRVPLLFSLCGCAQTIAALAALESAQGLSIHPSAMYARKVLLLAETAKELGLRLGRDWLGSQSLLPMPELLNWFYEIRSKLSWSLELDASPPEQSLFMPRFISELESILKGIVGPDELQFKEAVYAQSTTHPIGRVVSELSERFKGVELGPSCPEINVTTEYLINKLSQLEYDFCAYPHGEDGCCETSIWTRNRHRSMIKESDLLTMNPIAQRFLALLLELKVMPQRLLNVEQEKLIFSEKPGLAMVEAARGTLIHHVELNKINDESRVECYRIIAPTEWNFHPQGTLVSMLEGVRVPLDRMADLVGKLILAVDPCVAYEVEVH